MRGREITVTHPPRSDHAVAGLPGSGRGVEVDGVFFEEPLLQRDERRLCFHDIHVRVQFVLANSAFRAPAMPGTIVRHDGA